MCWTLFTRRLIRNLAIRGLCLAVVATSASAEPSAAGETNQKGVPWPVILSKMPLASPVTELNRTNAVRVILGAFRSNDVVKALIFLPGATDEFYMFRRARADLRAASPTLFDVVAALTNQTRLQVTFRSPFLLLHGDSDPLEPEVRASSASLTASLQKLTRLPHLEFNDTEWDVIQPMLKKKLHMDVRPWRYSSDSYHFYRSALSGWNLTDFEALEAIALASKTRVRIEKHGFLGYTEPAIRFENDLRLP
jgi:pimeloyl-ACP methyl ester carboxylesterase